MQCSPSKLLPSSNNYRLLKAMSTFAIQTSSGIFQLTNKVSPSDLQQDAQTIPKLGKNIRLLVPKSDESIFRKLTLLQSLSESGKQVGATTFGGFYTNESRFETVVCLCDVGDDTGNTLDLTGFDKVDLEGSNGENFVLKYSSLEGEVKPGDTYTLEHYPSYHPIVDSDEYKPVYSSYPQVLPALGLISTHNESLDLSEHISLINNGSLGCEQPLKHPFIVVEGLDGTGKSTLSKNLARYLKGVPMGTPPPSIASIRGHFDKFPQLYRRSFYALGNYIAAQQVIDHCKTQPVVMDRFWHSTTAYAIATEVGCGTTQHTPPKGHNIYAWPHDLLYPSAVVFLTTPEKDRDLRVNERDEQTVEEQRISVSDTFRGRITETYRRVGHEKWMEVDTSGTQEETLAKVVAALKSHGVID